MSMSKNLTPENIRAFRTEFAITRAELAERLNAGLRTIEDWEAGRRGAPGMLRLALAALAREIPPWQPTPLLGSDTTAEEASLVVSGILARLGDERASRIVDQFNDRVVDEATPAERVLCAHIIGLEDGYNPIKLWEKWQSWPRAGWRTSVVFWPQMHGAAPTIGVEARYDDKVRELAIFVDQHRPGERLPEKLKVETAMVTRGVRVVSLSAVDVLTNGERCRETIELIVSEMVDEVLYDAGKIANPWKRPDRR
ncbi:MAG: hypothetical protein V4514_04225 [Pseudomonadota bacterium]|uniref:helix-turn-helix domain-containing protein n=1 Tax=Phenylobacterium sp. TaxID=1871053 RepID=UPI0025F4CEDC|nr:hypothetical protein [Phenylobacterium sp.]MBT9471822.1 hypothetical protein [Phenylobacterium sp.]